MSSRDRILDGAYEVMRTRGLANATTKEIARTAGLSEAMLYKVFADKTDLFLGVFTERLPRVRGLDGSPDGSRRPGGTVQALNRLTADLLAFYLESFPIAASVFSDRDLLNRHREALHRRGAGPENVAAGVTGFLTAERRAGLIAPEVPTAVLAELLVGACLHRAFITRFAGQTLSPGQRRRFARAIVAALEPALAPSAP